MAQVNLTNHFLIAMPNIVDPYFARTLTFICEHNDQGALGVVVNRPIEMTLGALFDRLSLRLTSQILVNEPVYFGGPVQTDRGFVLHQPLGEWQSTLAVRGKMGLTTSKDILEAVGQGGGPHKLLVTLGYATLGLLFLVAGVFVALRRPFPTLAMTVVGGAAAGGFAAALVAALPVLLMLVNLRVIFIALDKPLFDMLTFSLVPPRDLVALG